MTRFDSAVLFAVNSHSGTTRKGSTNPYILHPMETAAIAASLTTDEDMLIAALLHDTIEDAGRSPEEIKEAFGGRVLALVLANTEKVDPSRPEIDTWMERKNAMIEYIKEKATKDEKLIILSDRLANLRNIHSDMQVMGEEVWSLFHTQTDKQVQGWYYHSIADEMTEFAGTAAYEEYLSLIRTVFGSEPTR